MSYDKILVPVAPGHGDETIKALEVARSLLSPDGRVSAVTVLEDLPRYMASEAYVVEPVFEESQQAAVDQVVQELSDLGVGTATRPGPSSIWPRRRVTTASSSRRASPTGATSCSARPPPESCATRTAPCTCSASRARPTPEPGLSAQAPTVRVVSSVHGDGLWS